jgi:hypothetical protein
VRPRGIPQPSCTPVKACSLVGRPGSSRSPSAYNGTLLTVLPGPRMRNGCSEGGVDVGAPLAFQRSVFRTLKPLESRNRVSTTFCAAEVWSIDGLSAALYGSRAASSIAQSPVGSLFV